VGGRDPSLLTERIARGGDAAVVRSNGDVASYDDLRAAVDRAAASLRAHGARAGRLVAVAASDPAGYLVASLAAWSAGAAVVPVDPRAGAGAMARLVERARPSIVVSSATLAGDLELTARDDARDVDPRVALLLFTSGSAAEPKGVLLSAEGVAANVDAILAYLPVRARSRIAVVVPLSYSYGLVGQALTTLTAGGALLLLNDLSFATEQVARMRDLGATGLSTVPASLRLLARAAIDGDAPLALDFCASAGAALDAPTVTLVRSACPGAILFNQYGLTEASPRVAAVSDREAAFANGAAGRPVQGVAIRVVGEDGAPVAPGVDGDIEVRGASVMLGYLDDREATLRAMTADGWLRTRDVGSLDRDGFVYVRGRSDGVVKRAGERVSVDEVAAALRRAPGVREACVVAVPDPEMGAELWAFLETDKAGLSAARALARAELPPAKRPRYFEAMDTMPRTANGKIAIAALREKTNKRGPA
jgi:acyl-CoA synthetase (AMP-forming)/AMP-acid ligase II